MDISFDKLSMKFHKRILFAKEASGKSGHICTWSEGLWCCALLSLRV